MDGFDLNSSEKADASELQMMIAIEQQKAQFQAQMSAGTSAWRGARVQKWIHGQTCLVSCVESFIDTTLSITNRFTQMVQKGAH
ncbi:mitochondrial import inner membrane translocase subunit Tim8 A [Salmo trutta]|uniref:Mitochondrial import inner membrane translocase subunit Tim8 A-like n=1 Tax=Salmo trutta TaxID=8032 RepID=A0A674CND4_SALTR|nr:mitochondrial import inner membrane translocase subunit Tim8 A-like [Salmo trutta]